MKHIAVPLLILLALTRPCIAGYKDGTGHEIAYGQNAQRIISLAPSATEMLYFLGFGSKLVGRTDYCNYPPEVGRVPSIGGMVDASLEGIVARKPDLVVAYQANSLELISNLRTLGILVVALPEATTLDEIGAQLTELNRICGLPNPEVPQKIKDWRARLTRLRRRPSAARSIFYGMPGEVVYTAGAGSFINDLIAASGGRNVVKPALKQRWPQVNAEFIIGAQPKWLLVSTPCVGHTDLARAATDARSSLRSDPAWNKLPAVRDGHIVVIDADILLRPGPRILDALEQLERAFDGAGK